MVGAPEDFRSSFSAHFAFIARRIAFGAGAAAAFFIPLRIARIAFAMTEKGGERLLLLRVWRSSFLEVKSQPRKP